MYNDIQITPYDGTKRFLRIYDSGAIDWYVGERGTQIFKP